MENTWADARACGSQVSVEIKIIYEDISQRPTNFIVEYFIDGEKFVKNFKNISGGGL